MSKYFRSTILSLLSLCSLFVTGTLLAQGQVVSNAGAPSPDCQGHFPTVSIGDGFSINEVGTVNVSRPQATGASFIPFTAVWGTTSEGYNPSGTSILNGSILAYINLTGGSTNVFNVNTPTGTGAFTVPIGEDPSLADRTFYFQAVTINLACPINTAFSASAVAAVTIGASTSDEPVAVMRNFIAKDGFTWTFNDSYETGQYVNGDWWVKIPQNGSVTVTSITPETANVNGRVINGSMINPGAAEIASGRNGYDSLLYTAAHSLELDGVTPKYKPNLNVALSLPLVITEPASLISTESRVNGLPSTYYDGNVFSQLARAAVLTFIDTPPPANAFRPPYTGIDKSITVTLDDIDMTVLANLPLLPNVQVPSLAEQKRRFERVWLDHTNNWTSLFMHPSDNMRDYYQSFTSDIGEALLYLNLDVPESDKRELLKYFLQVALDWGFNTQLGMGKAGPNGHMNARLWASLVAGQLLNIPTLLNAGINHPPIFFGPNHPLNSYDSFSEHGQTFYVEETSPGVYNWGYGGFGPQHVGLPWWGNFHLGNYLGIAGDSATWGSNPYQVCCSAVSWDGKALALHLMGLKPYWNHDSWFDYVQRYVETQRNVNVGSSGSTPFTRAYFETYGPVGNPSGLQ